MATAQHTRDHETIRRWAEDRNGVPTIVRGTGGLLRIDFVDGPETGGREPTLEQVEWDRWFKIFDESKLDFLYDPSPESRFFKLVSSKGEDRSGQAGSSSAGRARSKVS
jgi:hypothetical protein